MAEAKATKQTTKKPATVAKKAPAKKAEVKKPTVDQVKARARFVRIAPRKVRLVADELRGKKVVTALAHLGFISKIAAGPLSKLVNSAIANAEHNYNLEKESLYIKELTVNDGPIIKRFRPRAHGRAGAIRKRTSHIDLVLGVKDLKKSETSDITATTSKKKEQKKSAPAKKATPVAKKTTAKKPAAKQTKKEAK